MLRDVECACVFAAVKSKRYLLSKEQLVRKWKAEAEVSTAATLEQGLNAVLGQYASVVASLEEQERRRRAQVCASVSRGRIPVC